MWMRFDEVFKDDVWPRFATSGLIHAIWQPHKKVTHDWLIHNVGRSVLVLHKITVPSLVKASSWLKQSPLLLLFLRLMFFPGVLDSEAGNPSWASFLQLSSLGKCGLTAARLFAKRFRYHVLNFVESCTWVWDCKIAWIFIHYVVMVLPFEWFKGKCLVTTFEASNTRKTLLWYGKLYRTLSMTAVGGRCYWETTIV